MLDDTSVYATAIDIHWLWAQIEINIPDIGITPIVAAFSVRTLVGVIGEVVGPAVALIAGEDVGILNGDSVGPLVD